MDWPLQTCFEVLDVENEITSKENAIQNIHLNQILLFQTSTLSTRKTFLKTFRFKSKGQTVALVGQSGSGKVPLPTY
jgi:subfamily B ATP-binding cassette protein MsbA